MNKHLTEQQLIDYQFKLADEAGLNTARVHLEQCEACRQRLQRLAQKFASLDLLRDEIEVPEELSSRTVENATGNRSMGILPMSGFPNAIDRVWGPWRRAILALQASVFHGRDARATSQTPSQARPSRIIWLYRVPALGAVAAAVIGGAALLLAPKSGPDNRIAPTFAPAPPAQNADSAPVSDQEHTSQKDRSMSLVVERVGNAEMASQPKSLPFETPLAETQSHATSAAVGRTEVAPSEPVTAAGGPGNATLLSGIEKTANREIGVPGIPESAVQAGGARDATPYGAITHALDAVTRRARAPEAAEQPPFAPASAIELVVLPRRENVQLTIYNGADLTLVRERRNLTLKQGWNWLQFMWAGTLIDPTSLSLEPLEHKDGVQIQQLVFPPRLRELGRWLIHSDVGGQVPFELTYFTSGLAWRAFYMGTLSQDEKTMHLEGYVRINNNSGEDYENAETRLVVGRLHLVEPIAWLVLFPVPYGIPGFSMKDFMGTGRAGRGGGPSNGAMLFRDASRAIGELE
jgi:hypothetical protein